MSVYKKFGRLQQCVMLQTPKMIKEGMDKRQTERKMTKC